MECKYKIISICMVAHQRINRYIMECKCIIKGVKNLPSLLELIDTLWNVNALIVCYLFCHCGINRYIMECKCIIKRIRNGRGIELIDTLWNVNEKSFSRKCGQRFELIDTLWNVN